MSFLDIKAYKLEMGVFDLGTGRLSRGRGRGAMHHHAFWPMR